MSTITSANSVVTLAVAGLFPVPQQLHGYSADRAWETGNIAMTESRKGVDGRKTAGYIFTQPEQTFTCQADSPARKIFQAIVDAQKAAREVFYITGTIDLPATGESFICRKGNLKDANMLPDAGKVLQDVKYVIEWDAIDSTLS